VWDSFPRNARRFIIENNIRVFYLDAFQIARTEASNPELQYRMQGNAFQGAFFAASPLMATADLTEKSLFQAIRDQLQAKFGEKGAGVVEDNMRIVRRGYDEVVEITDKTLAEAESSMLRVRPAMPVMLKQEPINRDDRSSIHRFWEQTGNFYVRGHGSDNIVDPFIGLSVMPASTGIFRDMTQIRFEYPAWLPEKCTACGDCYTVCPDSAIPGLVNGVGEVFDTLVRRLEQSGEPVKHLRRALRDVEKALRPLMTEQGDGADVADILEQGIAAALDGSELEGEERAQLEAEFKRLRENLGSFRFALTKPYYNVIEKRAKGSGGLFSITVNPYTCKGCMECVTVCDDQALVAVTQTPEAVEELRSNWQFWLDLPNISPAYSRIDDLDEKIGALETLMLDKRSYGSMVCGDGACIGCGEKSVIHLFTGVVTALMQPRVKQQTARLEKLIGDLENHIRLKMAETMDLDDVAHIGQVVDAHKETDLTLSDLTAELDKSRGSQPLDPEWVSWATQLLARLKHLKWQYTDGITGRGRADMGMLNATGCTSVWGSTFPFNPYPFPWASHLFQDAPSVAMGVFEGHMAKMADGFKAIRMAEFELAGKYNPKVHEEFFTYFDWKQFSDEEFLLCPPVVAVGGDGAMYDIGFQNLSRMLMSGMPIKALVLDTQVYSNTGGQACTSGFIGQVADMTPFGKALKGKQEIRKEMSLIGMAHRTSYVLQGSLSNPTQLLEGYIEGLNSRRPALFNIYSVCQPEHGVGDDASELQSKLAVESRAYPLLKFDPDLGETWQECIDMDGNPALDADWPSYTLQYEDEKGKAASMELPFTFADFALTEGRFRKQFRRVPREAWNDEMVTVADYIELDEEEREDHHPYIWAVDRKQRLARVLVSAEIIASTEERRQNWRLLKSIAGLDQVVDAAQIENRVRAEMVQKLSAGLLSLVSGDGGAAGLAAALHETPGAQPPPGGDGAAGGNGEFEPVWIETPECTTCDECVEINPGIFAYNDDKLAYVVDPKAGSFKDIVRAAEKCTAGVLHPGTPWNKNEKDLDKLLKRAEKYQ
ncbi:MAG: thiamine pyrophosphate-dependent enzyme, partial [Pseudomonadota bacterium]|nr:thiamine pyrophosphate-dependent enzyme [Pseudomonadota bacterium]